MLSVIAHHIWFPILQFWFPPFSTIEQFGFMHGTLYFCGHYHPPSPTYLPTITILCVLCWRSAYFYWDRFVAGCLVATYCLFLLPAGYMPELPVSLALPQDQFSHHHCALPPTYPPHLHTIPFIPVNSN